MGVTESAGRGHGFGSLPVFLAGISTILGAVMFLRFGYAVGNVGFLGVCVIILLGHVVTIPTALAIAEIATNRKVEGGGEYFIISRSFGTTIGGVIGICLYFSQAISVAFYMIAFAEAFRELAPWFTAQTGLAFDPRYVSVPALVALVTLVFFRGAALGVKALYAVAVILLVSLVLFFFGSPVDDFDSETVSLTATVTDPDVFFVVFAIVFPAFTGMTAGVGLSGDLREPRVSIPRGTLGATLAGMVVYFFIVAKMALSAPPEALAEDQLIMSRIAVWGPIILIGLGSATLSSAIGSILVAPRTLQALGDDESFPNEGVNTWLAKGFGIQNEPRNTTLITGIFALVIVLVGNVNFVARLISMFFMVTYGSLCAISFLEHFAARPSYRPSFRSRWYVSLLGAVVCLFLMFQMDPLYALLAIIVLVGLYQVIKRTQSSEGDLGTMFAGVMTQATRYMHIRLQRRREHTEGSEWRPSIIMVNSRMLDSKSPLLMMRWLCHRYGFGTCLHFIEGRLDRKSFAEGRNYKKQLLELALEQKSTVYMDTIISPSMRSALAQSLQVPGVSGMNNNSVMFEFLQHDPPDIIGKVVENCRLVSATRMTTLVLRHGANHFGECKSIHVWLSWNDQSNADTMILLAYILLGHPDWKNATIKVFAALPRDQVKESEQEFERLAAKGRLPVSQSNIEVIPTENVQSFRRDVLERSGRASLTIVGFDMHGIRERGTDVFTNHEALKDVLFVHAPEQIKIE